MSDKEISENCPHCGSPKALATSQYSCGTFYQQEPSSGDQSLTCRTAQVAKLEEELQVKEARIVAQAEAIADLKAQLEANLLTIDGLGERVRTQKHVTECLSGDLSRSEAKVRHLTQQQRLDYLRDVYKLRYARNAAKQPIPFNFAFTTEDKCNG